ncbi:bifunctional alpha/beta hydrolase/OsmC family protein [Pelotalea chapellei]|uniref:OsmC family protein n=1 Tax=Pelotalea chapellei TaxID=44671 RepID=A0ABS5U6Y7_9BACT|nr:bifunctional alpha/beta hydrolase/OsmC family protein [Pelotalea chapellei]MBT1071420.1 OsmC family protein [Pelotalea chapellei]
MNTKRVTFPNVHGELIAARMELPEDERPLAYALFAHCFTCSKDLKAVVNISRALSSRRIAVLRFDFTGLGESEGDFSATSSLGGAAVLAAASNIPTTTAIVTIAAPFNPANLRKMLGISTEQVEQTGQATVSIGGRTFTIRKSLLDDLESQQPTETLRRLKAALLVMHSPRDQVVGIENAADIYRAAPHPKSFISLDSSDHLLSDPRDSSYAAGMIAAWAGRYLVLPDTSTPASIPPEVIDNRVIARTTADGFRTELFANGFPLIADEPVDLGGGNEGPSPYEYLLAALGACTGMTLQLYARKKGWPLNDVVVRLSHQKIHAEDCRDCDEKDRRIDSIERELEISGELDGAQRQRLMEISDRCPVHRTLTGEVRIKTILRPV